jgi:protein-S-isoprenylcysteine O-methyltransferase Ste14
MKSRHSLFPYPAAMEERTLDSVSAGATNDRGLRLRGSRLAVELALRIGTVALLLPFFMAALRAYMHDPTRITLLLFVIAEAITVVLALCTRVPRTRDWNPFSVVVAFCGTYYFLIFNVSPGAHLVPEGVAVALQATGFLLGIAAKLTLRRSFGILPANRGVVTSGCYRYVRHPMYLSYFVRDLGFLLANFGIQNALVVLVHWALQLGRILREERLLSADPGYKAYAKRVRYRIVYGMF